MAAMPREERLSLDEAAEVLGVTPLVAARWAHELGIGRRRLGKLTLNTGDLQRLAARAEWERRRAEGYNDWRSEREYLLGHYSTGR
jgi:predicted site-specific integrase-resolvase